MSAEVEAEVCSRLKRKHSPEQISGALRLEQGTGTSQTSIYNYVEADKHAGGDLHLNLRINGKRRYRHRNKANRHKLSGGVDIGERPIVVERRLRYGDWEVDLIAGCRGGGYLLSLYERKSRTGILVKLLSKDAEDTAVAIIAALKGLRVHTITYDNGLEFAGHQKVSEALGASGYFCQPYHSWEKGRCRKLQRACPTILSKGNELSQCQRG